METKTKQINQVGINIMEKSVTYISNTVFMLAFRIVHERGLSPEYINRFRKVIEDGLFTWLTEQKLRKLYIEIFTPGRDSAHERWDFEFVFYADPNEEVRKPPEEELEGIGKRLKKLPPGATYRIVAETDRGASKVPGWCPTTLWNLDIEFEKDFSGWGYGNIDGKLFYKKGRW